MVFQRNPSGDTAPRIDRIQTAFAYRSRVVQDVDSVRRRIPSVGPSSAIAIILLSTNVLTENPFVALIVVRRWIDEHIAKLGSRR